LLSLLFVQNFESRKQIARRKSKMEILVPRLDRDKNGRVERDKKGREVSKNGPMKRVTDII